MPVSITFDSTSQLVSPRSRPQHSPLLPRPAACDRYLHMDASDLPPMSRDELTVLELIVSLQCFEPEAFDGEGLARKRIADLLEVNAKTAIRRIKEAVSGLIELGFLDRADKNAVRPTALLQQFVPQKIGA